jgi:hypothetical protein
LDGVLQPENYPEDLEAAEKLVVPVAVIRTGWRRRIVRKPPFRETAKSSRPSLL